MVWWTRGRAAFMDWVVDLKNRRLIPNPEHKHGELADEFGASV